MEFAPWEDDRSNLHQAVEEWRGRGSLFPSQSLAAVRPSGLLRAFCLVSRALTSISCSARERRESAAFNLSWVASVGFSLFSSRLEKWIEASFVESLEGLLSKFIASIGKHWLQIWEKNG